MNAQAVSRRRKPALLPLEDGVISDAMFSALYPDRRYRIRKASPAEIRIMQPAEGVELLALVHWTDQGYRRRVLVECYGGVIDETLDPADIASLFSKIVALGWTWVGDRP